MTTRQWSVVDEHGTTLASAEADTGMSGAALIFHGTWHSPELLERYGALMLEIAQWLRDQRKT